MKAMTKYLAGAAAAAAMTVSAASPASAQIFGDPYGRNRGMDAGDIITGVAVMGGIAAILSALGRDGNQYGYNSRSQYRDDYRNAVNACAYEAERRGGQVSVTQVERRGYDSYRVRGVINAGGYGNNGSYGSYGSYGRYDPRYDSRAGNYGSYDPRYDSRAGRYDPRYDSNYGRYDTRYNDRYGNYGNYGSYGQQVAFACTARADGRVRDFDTNRL